MALTYTQMWGVRTAGRLCARPSHLGAVAAELWLVQGAGIGAKAPAAAVVSHICLHVDARAAVRHNGPRAHVALDVGHQVIEDAIAVEGEVWG